jgi:multidrug resistance efflux pump
MKRIIPVIIIIAALGGGYWWYSQQNATAVNAETTRNRLMGSGSIEAETLAVTAELGGRVETLTVDEGDEVEAGQVLIELDKTDLLAQQVQLEAAIATAKANLALVSAPPRPENVLLAQAQLAQAEVLKNGAELVWQRAARLANDPKELEARLNQMKAQVNEAGKQIELAEVNLKRAEIQAEAASRNQSNNVGLAQNESAQYQLQAARQGLNIAQSARDGAQKQVEHLIQLRDNPLSLRAQANAAQAAYKQAEAAVLAAQANLTAAKANPTPEDVNVARAQLQEAENALETIAVQLEKQTLTAPRRGLISQKLINPGEMANPGLTLLELSDIDTVDLTVYIPETQLGRVKIGQKAAVYVDAYAGETFNGQVTFMAHEAEFTPRNVQTQEERVNLVFGVKITLPNADHRLKPGMPADAEILEAQGLVAPAETKATPKATATTRPALPTATPKATATTAPILTATPTSAPTEAAPTQAKIIAVGLKVRQGPGLDFDLAGYLKQNDVVTVLDIDPETGWLHVQLPDGERTGWISASPTFVSMQ